MQKATSLTSSKSGLLKRTMGFFHDLVMKDATITVRFTPKGSKNKQPNELDVWADQSLADSLLGVRLLSPFIKDANADGYYIALINDYRKQRTLQLAIDPEGKRCYLSETISGPHALICVIILPQDKDQWPETIYNKVFPEYAI